MTEKSRFAIALLATTTIALAATLVGSCHAVSVAINPELEQDIQFLGSTIDNRRGESTWFYQVASRGSLAISELTLALPPDVTVVDAGTWDEDFADRTSTGQYAVLRNELSHQVGIRFVESIAAKTSQRYFVTIDKVLPEAIIDARVRVAGYHFAAQAVGALGSQKLSFEDDYDSSDQGGDDGSTDDGDAGDDGSTDDDGGDAGDDASSDGNSGDDDSSYDCGELIDDPARIRWHRNSDTQVWKIHARFLQCKETYPEDGDGLDTHPTQGVRLRFMNGTRAFLDVNIPGDKFVKTKKNTWTYAEGNLTASLFYVEKTRHGYPIFIFSIAGENKMVVESKAIRTFVTIGNVQNHLVRTWRGRLGDRIYVNFDKDK